MQELPKIGELMDRASSGDDDAFARLAAQAQDTLYRFALAHLLNTADAAESVQETLLRAYRGRRGWKTGAEPWSWLFGIAMNVVREGLRKRRRQVALELPGEQPDAAGRGGRDARAGPAAQVERMEDLDRLARAIALLPPRQREALTCRHLRQMSVRETARTMSCAEGTVKAAVSAAMDSLRKLLEHGT